MTDENEIETEELETEEVFEEVEEKAERHKRSGSEARKREAR